MTGTTNLVDCDTGAMALNWVQRVSLETARGTVIESIPQAQLLAEILCSSYTERAKQLALANGYVTTAAGLPTGVVSSWADSAPITGGTERRVSYLVVPFSCLRNPMTYPDLSSTEPMVLNVSLTGGGATGAGLLANGFGTSTTVPTTAILKVNALSYMSVTSQSDRLQRQAIEFKGGVSTVPLLGWFPESPIAPTSAYAADAGKWESVPIRCRNSVKYTFVYVKRATGKMAPSSISSVVVKASGTELWRSDCVEGFLPCESALGLIPTSMSTNAGSVVVIPWALIRSLSDKEQAVSCEGGIHFGSVPNPTIDVYSQDVNEQPGGAAAPMLYVVHAFYQASQYTTNASGLNFAWAITDVD